MAAISEAVSQAAAEVFLADGFEDASMEAIALRAGVTRPTLYKRFPDKRSLLRAVLLERRLRWSPAKPAAADLEQRLKYYAETMLVWSISPEFRAFNNLAASAWKAPDEMIAREEVLGYNEMLNCLEQEIRDSDHELGVFSTAPRAVAAALMAMLTGWFEHRTAEPSSEEAVEFAHRAVELLLHGKSAW